MKNLNWSEAYIKVIGGLLTIILAFIAWQSTNWNQNIAKLSDNVGQLNTKMEVVITEIANTKQINYDHELRLREVEKKFR